MPAKLPPIREPLEILGAVTAEAARETGLAGRHAGAGRRCRLSGGAARLRRLPPGPRLRRDRHLLHPDADRRGAAARPRDLQRRDGRGTLGTLRPARDRRRRDALGAARLSREGARATTRSSRAPPQAPAGSDGLFFMPYLTGERLGAHRNARAQFFGLGAAHGLAASAPRGARRRRLRGRAPPAHHGEGRRPQARARHRLGRRRQDARSG